MKAYTEDLGLIETHVVYLGRTNRSFSTARAAAISFGWDPNGIDAFKVVRIVLHKSTSETAIVFPDSED